MYTLVRHSSWTERKNRRLRWAVEERRVTRAQADAITAAGGVVYATYDAALEAAFVANYPRRVGRGWPRVRGRFARLQVAWLVAYVPPAGSPARSIAERDPRCAS